MPLRLNALQKKQLSAALPFLWAPGWPDVQQGIGMIRAGCAATGDRLLWEYLGRGLRLDGNEVVGKGNPQLNNVQQAHRYAVALYAIRASGQLDDVPTLLLRGPGSHTDLDPLAGLQRLAILVLNDWPLLTDLSAVAEMPALHTLFLYNCPALTDLAPLAQAAGLATLSFVKCGRLTDLRPLAGLAALTRIELCGCPALTDLSPLIGLQRLADLSLRDAHALTDLSPLDALPALKALRLRGCRSLPQAEVARFLQQRPGCQVAD